MEKMVGQMSIFDFPEYLPDDQKSDMPCDDCSNEEQGSCTYNSRDDYCVLGDKKNICRYSGHECNKQELWRIAAEENPFCPHVCCRQCSEALCGVRCNGAAVPKKLEDEEKAGKCEYCAWWNKSDGLRETQGCMWMQHYPGHLDEDDLKNHSCWMPQTKGMKVCATCKHSNDFIYEGEDMYHPVENNDLYCDLEDFYGKTPINRRELFQKYRTRNFGVGYYHRQHEYDTCDLWEKEK